MNGNNQPQQEQHSIAERVARLETAINYHGQALAGLREEMRAGFVRTDTGFDRVDEQLMKTRTTDFRILLSIGLTTALGTMSLIVKVFGLL